MSLRLQRLFKEAVEIAFFLCNTEKSHFGGYKILDLVDQIIPTAYILNSSYWVFYNLEIECRRKLCVCERYAINCRHRDNRTHCLDMSDVNEVNGYFFTNKTPGGVFPSKTFIQCKLDLVTGVLSASLLIRVSNDVAHKKESSVQSYSFGTTVKFIITRELEPQFEDFIFSPHPVTNPNYSEYISELLIYYWSRDNLLFVQLKSDFLPTFTFIQESVPEISTFQIAPEISIVGTQTNSSDYNNNKKHDHENNNANNNVDKNEHDINNNSMSDKNRNIIDNTLDKNIITKIFQENSIELDRNNNYFKFGKKKHEMNYKIYKHKTIGHFIQKRMVFRLVKV